MSAKTLIRADKIDDNRYRYRTRPGSTIEVIKKWIDKERADEYLRKIQEEIPMAHYDMGRYTPPRRYYVFGDPDIANVTRMGIPLERKGYIYNPQNKKDKGYAIHEWMTPLEVMRLGTPRSEFYRNPTTQSIFSPRPVETYTGLSIGWEIKCIMDIINASTSVGFNSALLNEYKDGYSSISKHEDKEAMGRDNAVYGISLGDSRKFYFYGKKGTPAVDEKISLEIEHGDLMIMSGLTQEYYQHEIKKEENKGYRVSITYRHL